MEARYGGVVLTSKGALSAEIWALGWFVKMVPRLSSCSRCLCADCAWQKIEGVEYACCMLSTCKQRYAAGSSNTVLRVSPFAPYFLRSHANLCRITCGISTQTSGPSIMRNWSVCCRSFFVRGPDNPLHRVRKRRQEQSRSSVEGFGLLSSETMTAFAWSFSWLINTA
jgi:hypothetical protein